MYKTYPSMWKFLKKISPLEIIVFIVFFLYILVPIELPHQLNQLIDTPLGISLVLFLALAIFLYTNPILGVLALFVAYELIRRASVFSGSKVAMIQNPTPIPIRLPTAEEPQVVSTASPGPSVQQTLGETLEVDVVQQMAPLSTDATVPYMETGFKPVAENVHNASSI